MPADTSFVRTDSLAEFFGITEQQLRAWLATKVAPDNLRVPGRSDGPRLADPEVRDTDLCTTDDICAFYRCSKETLRRWIITERFPRPDASISGKCHLWKVRTARAPKAQLERQRRKKA